MGKKKTVSIKKARAEVEAAEKQAKTATKKKAATKKAATKKKVTRKKRAAKEPARFRLIWGVYSSSMKEESRFSYDQRKEAEKKTEQLKAKSKKLYWIQPIKEEISDEPDADDDA
ncbi:MAG: hypothetical protein QF363_10305 [Planctomycetaceae bacterium]|jgi:hypothetical protein|nr:hypothetical protein [Planctomycetaceae bacterium]